MGHVGTEKWLMTDKLCWPALFIYRRVRMSAVNKGFPEISVRKNSKHSFLADEACTYLTTGLPLKRIYTPASLLL